MRLSVHAFGWIALDDVQERHAGTEVSRERFDGGQDVLGQPGTVQRDQDVFEHQPATNP
jgi:hypothetical protein